MVRMGGGSSRKVLRMIPVTLVVSVCKLRTVLLSPPSRGEM